jgi:hypothetical protein
MSPRLKRRHTVAFAFFLRNCGEISLKTGSRRRSSAATGVPSGCRCIFFNSSKSKPVLLGEGGRAQEWLLHAKVHITDDGFRVHPHPDKIFHSCTRRTQPVGVLLLCSVVPLSLALIWKDFIESRGSPIWRQESKTFVLSKWINDANPVDLPRFLHIFR